MLWWLIWIILGEIIFESSNWQHTQRLKITILGANWQLFRSERMAKCSYFILSKIQNIKFYWFVIEKKLCCQFDDNYFFLLRIKIGGLRSEWVESCALSPHHVKPLQRTGCKNVHCYHIPVKCSSRRIQRGWGGGGGGGMGHMHPPQICYEWPFYIYCFKNF